MFDVSRIMIIGRPGSGKSTFALALHKKLNIPLVHLDKYFFTDNWQERDYAEFLTIQKNFVAEPTWIIDGNSTQSFAMRYQRATVCIYFNFPRKICYWRIFKRLFVKNSNIDDRAPHCHETVRWSLIKYIWSFEQRIAKSIPDLKAKYPNVYFAEVRSDEEVNQLMHAVT